MSQKDKDSWLSLSLGCGFMLCLVVTVLFLALPIMALYDGQPLSCEIFQRLHGCLYIGLASLWGMLLLGYAYVRNDFAKLSAEKRKIREDPWSRWPPPVRISSDLSIAWDVEDDPLDTKQWVTVLTLGQGVDHKHIKLTQAQVEQLYAWIHRFRIEVRVRKNYVSH